MAVKLRSATDWVTALRWYLLASLVLHLVWEVVQLPLYTIWSEPLPTQAFAVLHCTAGDLMIAGLSLLAALALVATPDWPRSELRRVWLLLLVFGVGYTIYSEWMNVDVRGNWAYCAGDAHPAVDRHGAVTAAAMDLRSHGGALARSDCPTLAVGEACTMNGFLLLACVRQRSPQ